MIFLHDLNVSLKFFLFEPGIYSTYVSSFETLSSSLFWYDTYYHVPLRYLVIYLHKHFSRFTHILKHVIFQYSLTWHTHNLFDLQQNLSMTWSVFIIVSSFLSFKRTAETYLPETFVNQDKYPLIDIWQKLSLYSIFYRTVSCILNPKIS